jgi:hypothetical protein
VVNQENLDFTEMAYKTIEAMSPGKQFTVRLLIGMTGLDPAERPKDWEGSAYHAIVRADKENLCFLVDVKRPSRRAGFYPVWERFDMEDDA